MAIRVACPACNKVLVAPDEVGGQERACPFCSTRVRLPMPDLRERASRNHRGGGDQHGGLTPHKRVPEMHDLIDMTAMVDIVFFLLIYFLVTSLCGLQAAVDAPYPEATLGKTAASSSSTREAQTGEALTVRIDEDDMIWFDEESIGSGQDLAVRLKNAKEQQGAERLRIAGSSDATHGKLIMILDAGHNAGMTRVSLAIEETP